MPKKSLHRTGRTNFKNPETEKTPKESYEEAQKIVKLHDDPKHKSKEKAHPILDGVTGLSGDRIMSIVSMRIDGHTDAKIGELIGVAQPNIVKMEQTHPEAFAQAEAYHLRHVERKYQINLWGVRAALSQAAPEAVQVLHELMLDKETPHHIRRSCAVDILNLSGAGYTRKSVGGRDSRIFATQINNLASALDDKFADGDVVDAEYEEEK